MYFITQISIWLTLWRLSHAAAQKTPVAAKENMDITIHEDADGWSRSGTSDNSTPSCLEPTDGGPAETQSKLETYHDPVLWGFREFYKV